MKEKIDNRKWDDPEYLKETEGLMNVKFLEHMLNNYPNDFSDETKKEMIEGVKKINELKLKGEVEF